MRITFTLPGLTPDDMQDGDSARLTEGLRRLTGIAPAAIRFDETEDRSAASDPHTLSPQPSPIRAAEQLVRDFLAALEIRDLDRAADMTAPDFRMVFPGPAVFDDFEGLLAWAAPRYSWVKKTIEATESCLRPDGSVSVYCFGTLYGEWLSGKPFRDIRFIDRFLVRAGKLVQQDVWNDLAEGEAQSTGGPTISPPL